MGVDTSPLVLYCIYLQEGTHSESAIKVIEGQGWCLPWKGYTHLRRLESFPTTLYLGAGSSSHLSAIQRPSPVKTSIQ